MQWYVARTVKSDKSLPPPAYLEERVGDLAYALELSITSPSESRSVLTHVALRLKEHNDSVFAEAVQEAARRMSDNPAQSREIVEKVMAEMRTAKQLYDENERKNLWKKK